MKKGIIIFFVFLGIFLLVFIPLSKKEEVTARKDKLDDMEYNEKLLPSIPSNKDGERFYLGKWIILDKWMGATSFEIVDAADTPHD